MKKWVRIAVMQEGIREGVELIKAESAEEAKNILTEDWADYPYTDDVEAYELHEEPLTMEQEKQCALQDLVEVFLADGCTKAEAERHIKNGSEAIKASEWEQYIKDTDLRDGEGELLSAEDAKKELGARSVMVDGEEYFLLSSSKF